MLLLQCPTRLQLNACTILYADASGEPVVDLLMQRTDKSLACLTLQNAPHVLCDTYLS